jgi:serine O-acetyltransferase
LFFLFFRQDMDQDWLSDLQRVGASHRAMLREQSLWAIWVYRFGCRVDKRPDGLFKKIMVRWYWLLHRFVETLTGIGLPKAARIGGGLRIWHFGGIFVHPEVVMGKNCTLRQGVTLGDKGNGTGAPVIGDHVDFGSGAHVIGPVHIGSHVKVGALAVVVCDVPDGCTVVGNPARIIKRV